jgi:hypothetical protein
MCSWSSSRECEFSALVGLSVDLSICRFLNSNHFRCKGMSEVVLGYEAG